MRWTEADLAERGLRVSTDPLERAQSTSFKAGANAIMRAANATAERSQVAAFPPTPKPNKYRAHKRAGPNFMGGERLYRSQWEAEVARQLRDEMMAGQIKVVLPEVSFVVGQDENGRDVRHRVDFACVSADGTLVLVEAKGLDLAAGRAKRAVLNARGLDVQVRLKPKRGRK
jgi:hypothetical protein